MIAAPLARFRKIRTQLAPSPAMTLQLRASVLFQKPSSTISACWAQGADRTTRQPVITPAQAVAGPHWHDDFHPWAGHPHGLGWPCFAANIIIGIAHERLFQSGKTPWPELQARAVPIAVPVGHLRRTRGLDRLIEIKAKLGQRIEILVVANPYFTHADTVLADLAAAGMRVDRGFIASMADVYHSVGLYLFPPPPQSEGAIELPRSVLEAVSCGLPVVSTAFGALPEALAGIAGVRFVDGDAFAQAVEDAINSGLTEHPAGSPENLNAHRFAARILEFEKP